MVTRRPTLAAALAVAVMGSLAPPPASAEEANEPALTFAEATKQGKVSLSFRYRFENVSDEAFAKDARASTLRTLLSYRSLPFRGFSWFVEAENSTEVGSKGLFNDLAGNPAGNPADRPVVADPRSTEINQAYLRFERGRGRVDLGRQEINLADQRFVGAVGWRQNHQSFDALALRHEFSDSLAVSYHYLDEVHRIFGDHKPLAGHLIDGRWQVTNLQLRVYGYLLDFDDLVDARSSTDTYGFEISGKQRLGTVDGFFEIEIAEQTEAGDNPADVDASYLHTLLGGSKSGWKGEIGFERLEGGPGGRFSTPLATLHKWNGWADKFLATPEDGLEDFYLALSGKKKTLGWRLVYHEFSAESSSLDYGSEVDFQLTYEAPWGQGFGAKAAFYEAEDFSTDTDKVWLWTTYSF